MRYHFPNLANTSLGDDDDDDDTPSPSHKRLTPFHYYEHTISAQHIHFYLNEQIGAASLYADMIHRINVAGPEDTVYIHVNTPGGQLNTGVQIINAIRNSPATIITVLESAAYSLGTLIFLSGDEMIVNDNCIIMFHNFRGGVIGKGNELVSELEATIKWFTELARQIYIPFLSEQEFERITKGEDLWLLTEDIKSRLHHMVNDQEKPEQTSTEVDDLPTLAEKKTKRKVPASAN